MVCSSAKDPQGMLGMATVTLPAAASHLISCVACCSRRATVTSHSFFSWNPGGSWGAQRPYWTLWSQWSWLTLKSKMRKRMRPCLSSDTASVTWAQIQVCSCTWARTNSRSANGRLNARWETATFLFNLNLFYDQFFSLSTCVSVRGVVYMCTNTYQQTDYHPIFILLNL